ncbi:unnamed protein product [Parnassius apollo]|uniref:(apollo) hypothetical protein n=1 Tax=Parnassius apollo TaxID=110799 RepID=A0A8S3X461_PARAO|nr:unnamed protein product [Parnassius apollo]
MNELSWGVKLQILKDYSPEATNRRVGMEALVDGRQHGYRKNHDPVRDYEENAIKLKLFRMMHESISDSEAKIKKLKPIKRNYENSTSFEIGYIVGVASEKYGEILDLSATLDRLYHEWRPLDHINAYEHVANKGIEINQLIDLAKSITKSVNETAAYRRRLLNLSL